MGVITYQCTNPDSDYGQLVPKTTRTQENSYPRQLVPRTTRTQDNSYPGQLVPKTTRTQDVSYPAQLVSYRLAITLEASSMYIQELYHDVAGRVKRGNSVFDLYFPEFTQHLAPATPPKYVYFLCVLHNGIYLLELFRLSNGRTWINRQGNAIGTEGESLLTT